MNDPRVDFSSLPWTTLADGAQEKRLVRDRYVMRLLEFTPPFVEKEWCVKSHTGYVVEGEFAIQFRDRKIAFKAGDGLYIDGSEGSEHKAVVDRRVLLFLIEVSVDL